ncbi:hypothetical protein NEF87_003295 [Candidatus Lokiarchaeum ossiferum]|uniref:Peptidase C-terminal archaeal/bacterial domain-containing protein n=1 Tax=Candidatus Lokiarchaeum ossiferum TaxID=2951803 RepID=A0ABY6HU10_9ARCH|nr:hypothetical protein NEF87_003295 [Candidatus Lokiarchaeum sp. B-35]
MKRKNISLTMSVIILVSLTFSGIPMTFGTSPIKMPTVKASDLNPTSNISVVEGDVLYYHFTNVREGEDGDDGPDDGVIKLVVSDLDTSNDFVHYDFFFPNVSNFDDWGWDGETWNDMTENMTGDNERWTVDDFTYRLFNHTILIENNITDVGVLALAENTDQLIKDTFGATTDFESSYSTSAGWHIVDFSLNKSDDLNAPFSVNAWFNQETGLMTYYKENDNGTILILELAGYDGNTPGEGLDQYSFDVPDSFGFVPGDYVDRFNPQGNENNYDDGDGGDGWTDEGDDNPDDGMEEFYDESAGFERYNNPEEQYDEEEWVGEEDWLEDNDDFNNPTELTYWPALENHIWLGLNTYNDDDHFATRLDAYQNLTLFTEYYSGADVKLYWLNETTQDIIQETPGETIVPTEYEYAIDSIFIEPVDYDRWIHFMVNASASYNFNDTYHVGQYYDCNWEEMQSSTTRVYPNYGSIENWWGKPDYMEDNDIMDTASDLNSFGFPLSLKYLNLHDDDDWYKVYVNSGDQIKVELEYYTGADVDLYLMNNSEDILQNTDIYNTIKGYPMVRDYWSIDYTATYTGFYYLKVNGSEGYWNDTYSINVIINNDWDNWIDIREDKFEDNDDYLNPFWLDTPARYTHYNDLSKFDDDYFVFWGNEGWHYEVVIHCDPDCGLELSEIDPAGGGQVNPDDSDEDGYLQVDIDPSESHELYFKVTGANIGVNYNIEIRSGEPPTEDDGDDDDGGDGDDDKDQGIWSREWISFAYSNPATGEDVIIGFEESFDQPDMVINTGARRHRVLCRVDPIHPDSAIGEGYFHKNINFQSPEFEAFITDIIENDINLTAGYELIREPGILEIHGTMANSGQDFYLFVEQLGHDTGHPVGTVRMFHQKQWNSSAEDKWEDFHQDLVLTINCSVAGSMTKNHPELGVVEGDWWTYIVQNERYEDNWGSDNDDKVDETNVIVARFTVTHIFALNRTVMGVVGSMETMQMTPNLEPVGEYHKEGFQPFLVWDTTNPASFMTMGGLGQIDGPPVLLPAGVDWTTQENAIITMFGNMDGPPEPFASNFGTNTIRLRFDEQKSDSWSDGSGYEEWSEWTFQQDVILDVNNYGMTAYLDMYMKQNEEFNNTNDEPSGYDREESFVGFLVNSSYGITSESDISSITGVQSLDVYEWEQSEYRPTGYWNEEDTGADPSEKGGMEYTVGAVRSTDNEYVVFLGSIRFREPGSSTWDSETWQYEEDGIAYNMWFLSTIRDEDMWTLANTQFFDIGMTDWSAQESELLDILNYYMELPEGVTITTEDLTISGTTFEMVVDRGDGIESVMKIAVNEEGILQDFFMGTRYISNGTWTRWQRQVLVSAPTGVELGEVFTSDIPDNYVSWDGSIDDTIDDTDTTNTTSTSDTTSNTSEDVQNLFDSIPGYPTAVMGILSMIALLSIAFHKRK